MSRRARLALLAAAFAGAISSNLSAQAARPDAWRFVVLGHIRGNARMRINPKLAELVQRVRDLHPDFVVLTGDAIWGDVEATTWRPEVVEDEWNAVDSALAGIGVPIYRTPGNHDISSVMSRDIWRKRYGTIPSVVTHKDAKLILLTSTFIPPDGDTTRMKHIGGIDLDSAQLAFLRGALAAPPARHTFVFMHHLLWWEPDGGAWWRDVHPLLAAAHVDDVFSGDYGPMKFSTMEKDGVRYFQGSLEPRVPLERLQRVTFSRLLSSQLDVFFEVQVAGDSAKVIVHPVAEVSGGDFTPARYREIDNAPPLTTKERIRELLRDRRKLMMLAAAGGLALVVGFLLGRASRGRRAA